MLILFSHVGRPFANFIAAFGRVASFTLVALWVTLKSREGLASTATVAVQLFVRCLIPVALVAAPISAMRTIQTIGLTSTLGVERLLPPLLAATIVRELSPGFSSVMICFQAGAGIAAELGTMRVREELDALDVMGLDSRALVVGPRILAAAIIGPLLNVWGMFCGAWATYLIAVWLKGMPQQMFIDGFIGGISVLDLWVSEGKTLIFGGLIGAISATFGFYAEGGTAGVGNAANRAVVATVIVVLMANYILNTLLLGLFSVGSL